MHLGYREAKNNVQSTTSCPWPLIPPGTTSAAAGVTDLRNKGKNLVLQLRIGYIENRLPSIFAPRGLIGESFVIGDVLFEFPPGYIFTSTSCPG